MVVAGCGAIVKELPRRSTDQQDEDEYIQNYMCYLQKSDSPIMSYDEDIRHIEFLDGPRWDDVHDIVRKRRRGKKKSDSPIISYDEDISHIEFLDGPRWDDVHDIVRKRRRGESCFVLNNLSIKSPTKKPQQGSRPPEGPSSSRRPFQETRTRGDDSLEACQEETLKVTWYGDDTLYRRYIASGETAEPLERTHEGGDLQPDTRYDSKQKTVRLNISDARRAKYRNAASEGVGIATVMGRVLGAVITMAAEHPELGARTSSALS